MPPDPTAAQDSMIFLDPSHSSVEDLNALGLKHNPFTALVMPRPIGWISTLSVAGVANLAPFSFFAAASQNPQMVMFCANAQHGAGGPKDSLLNATDTGEFVVNLATWPLRAKLNASSAMVGRGVDEFALAGLSKLPSRLVRAPRVAESPAHLECRVVKIVDLTVFEGSGNRNTAVFGRVVGMHIDRSLLVDGDIDPRRADPLARLGNLDYARIGEIEAMARP
jgi:flavin reductase (DIM6/NTAB) family NADH-FMN oxidoreductase RutF